MSARRRTFRWRDWPIVVLCVGVLIALTWIARRSR